MENRLSILSIRNKYIHFINGLPQESRHVQTTGVHGDRSFHSFLRNAVKTTPGTLNVLVLQATQSPDFTLNQLAALVQFNQDCTEDPDQKKTVYLFI